MFGLTSRTEPGLENEEYTSIRGHGLTINGTDHLYGAGAPACPVERTALESPRLSMGASGASWPPEIWTDPPFDIEGELVRYVCMPGWRGANQLIMTAERY
jgi:hypothetical protein